MSSRNSGRSPKDLRHLLSLAEDEDEPEQQDNPFFPDQIKENLGKLKMLPEEELTENAMLRGRIEQQSELICILKRQADTSLNKVLTLEKETKALQQDKDQYMCDYNEQVRKFETLKKRFDVLCYNHEEIIKIKDDYKRTNDELRNENKLLCNTKYQDESVMIKQKDTQIENLHQKIFSLTKEYENEKEQLSKSLKEACSREKETIKLLDDFKLQKSDAEVKVQELEKREKLLSSQISTKEQEIRRLQCEADNYKKVLTNEKQKAGEYEKRTKELLERVQELEMSSKMQAEKVKKILEEASTNAQVRKLTAALTKAEEKIRNHDQEFVAYKSHMDKLLLKEKDLNNKLRQLIG